MTDRGLSATNQTEIAAASLQTVILARLDFDTPVYAHSGFGDIVFGGNTYLGVGDFGGIGATRESEVLGPSELTLTLSGVDANLIAEALDSGNFRDKVYIYIGYRQDDGTLVDDPWLIWSGFYDHSEISVGQESAVSIVCRHDLAELREKAGDRYTDEDQQSKYSGDLFFEFVADMPNVRLPWGRFTVGGGGSRSDYVRDRVPTYLR